MPEPPRFDGDFRGGRPTFGDRVGSFVGDVIRTLFTTIALGALGLVVTLFLPQHVRRVGQAAEKAPVASAAVGCLAMPVLVIGIVITAITIIGIPIAVLLPVLFAAASVLGWIGLGFVFGDRLLRSADIRSPRPAAAAAIGSGGLMLASSVVGIVPIIGWIVSPLLWAWGLGAALLTRGGTQNYPARMVSANAPVPPLSFDPLDNIPPTPPPARPQAKKNDLFADLAADLGLEEEELLDDEDTKPSRETRRDKEDPLPPL